VNPRPLPTSHPPQIPHSSVLPLLMEDEQEGCGATVFYFRTFLLLQFNRHGTLLVRVWATLLTKAGLVEGGLIWWFLEVAPVSPLS